MGRKDKKYRKSLKGQCDEVLRQMLCFGESKLIAKKSDDMKGKIFSKSTYSNYRTHCHYFLDYVKNNHPEETKLDGARKYIKEYIDYRISKGLSAWTIKLDACAINKLYGISEEDDEFVKTPPRKRENIKRSRYPAKRDKNFNEAKHPEFVNFCRGTGLRSEGIKSIKGDCLYTKEQLNRKIKIFEIGEIGRPHAPEQKLEYKILKDTELFDEKNYIKVKEKGGKVRYAPILDSRAKQIVARIKATPPDKKVWANVNKNADIHSYRADYATEMYKKYARNIEDISKDIPVEINGKTRKNGIYTCRREDESGKKLDVVAQLKVSKALGHNRLDVVAENYLREI